jgi:hypothetical protein
MKRRRRSRLVVFCNLTIAFAAGEMLWSGVTMATGIVPAGSRIFMTVSGPENICGAADANHNAFCAVASGPTVPVDLPLTTYADPRGASFGFITASASVTSGKTATGTTNSSSGPFEFISINDTYTVHGTAGGAFPITATLHITGSFGTIPTGPPFGNILSFEASQLEIGTFHPEATLTQFIVDPFPPDANNPATARVNQSQSTVVSQTPVTFPLDVQVSYTKIVDINDVFDMAYSIDLNLSGKGQINMIPTTDVISFTLPPGVFLTSALGATFGTAPNIVGDYNSNGVVDAADYILWRKTLGQTATGLAADGSGNGSVGQEDYDVWTEHFGNTSGSGAGALAGGDVAEPVTLWPMALGLILVAAPRFRSPASRTRAWINCTSDLLIQAVAPTSPAA